ncbi:MAG TPA: plasmid pRiA4b ORF-3 family protein [Bdellovibrio sp.]|nr:plasmid pRiA4b ORF-3 family protein [Bdellovibrio sp.]
MMTAGKKVKKLLKSEFVPAKKYGRLTPDEKAITKPQAVQLKIVLTGTQPLVWRRIHILANSTLRTLQFTISDVMEWNYMHLYKFVIDEDEYGDPELDCDYFGWLDDSKITVGRVLKKVSKFEFIYDFGDNWSHQIIFEDIFNANPKERYPVCISGENASPPENCGGVHGFEEFKKSTPIIKKRQPKNIFDSLDMMRVRSGFDPYFFDLIRINEIKMSRRRKVNSPKKK